MIIFSLERGGLCLNLACLDACQSDGVVFENEGGLEEERCTQGGGYVNFVWMISGFSCQSSILTHI